MALERLVEADEREPGVGRRLDDEAQPRGALVPPVPQQLGVQRAHAQPAAGDALAHARHEVDGVRSRLLARPRGVVDGAVDRPRPVLVLGLAP